MRALILVFLVFCSLNWVCGEKEAIQTSNIDLNQPLTLQNCIDLALKYHPSLAIAMGNLQGAESRLIKVRSNYYPQLEVSSQNNISGVPRVSLAGGRLTQSKTSYLTNLVLSQTLYASGRGETVEQSKQALLMSKSNLRRAQQELIFSVTQNYFAVLKAQRLAKVAEETVKQAEEHLRMAKERVAAGAAAPVDTLPAEVELANAKLALIKAENQIQVSLASLKNSIGLAPTQSIKIREVLGQPKVEVDLEKCHNDAYAKRPELIEKSAEIKVNQLAVKINQIKQGPLVTIDGNYTREIYTSLTPRPEYWTANAIVSLPLFDGGAAKAAVEEAKANLEVAKAQERQLKQSIALEVEQAFLELKESLERIEATTKSVESAKANLSAAEERYKEGIAIMLEVIEARAALTEAETNYVQALYDYNVAIAKLNKAIGI